MRMGESEKERVKKLILVSNKQSKPPMKDSKTCLSSGLLSAVVADFSSTTND